MKNPFRDYDACAPSYTYFVVKHAVENTDDLELLAGGKAFLGDVVDDGQHPEATAARQLVCTKLVDQRRFGPSGLGIGVRATAIRRRDLRRRTASPSSQ